MRIHNTIFPAASPGKILFARSYRSTQIVGDRKTLRMGYLDPANEKKKNKG